MSELTINGIVYAKYQMDTKNSILYLKMLIQLEEGKENVKRSEDLLIFIIQLVEKTKFHTVSYLNV